jgi:scyllo-inositol 2-dehydrogenase (NADP+)
MNADERRSKVLRVGIVGFGRIGSEHPGWINRASGLCIEAVFDPTEARRNIARSNGLRTVDSIEALLQDESIEAVLIATPSSMHFDHASQALNAHKHVMVEKPFALNLRDAKHLTALSGSSGKTLSVFHNRRFDIDYLTLKHAIDSNAFGRVFNVESRLGQWSSCVGPAAREWNPNWRNQTAFGGGGLFDWGSHFIDQIWQMMLPAKPQAVFAQLRGNIWSSDPDCDDFARACINFDNGATGLVEINTTTTRPLPRWHIDGEHGSADSPFSLTFDTNEWARLTFAPADNSMPRMIEPAPRGLDEVQIWEQFAAACRGEGEPAITARSVLPTMALLDAARESSRSGQSILVDPSLFK